MSAKNELLPGNDLGEYRLIEEIAPRTWRAQHLITPREVCLRVLTHNTASDPARRDEILTRLRTAATIGHPAFPKVRNVVVADDWIVLASDLPAASPFDEWLGARRLSMPEWGRFAWQLFSALDVLHRSGVVHGAIDGTTVRVDEGGNVRIDLPGFAALTGRAERGDLTYLASELSPSQLAHRSPEALLGASIDARADLFSAGVLVYRALTGLSPFEAAATEEVAARVANHNPRNPRDIDPDIPAPALTVVGRSLFKKAPSRYASANAALSDLRTLDPNLETVGAYPPERRSTSARQLERRTDLTNIIVADIPFWEMLQARNPESSERAAARMQQALGESVYLYDGEVLDSLGHRFIAIIPDSSGAVTAVYRSLDEIAAAMQGAESVEPRVLIVRGVIERDAANLGGAGLELALRALESLAPGQCLVDGRVLDKARLHPSDAAVGQVGEVELFALPARTAGEPAAGSDDATLVVRPTDGDDTIAVVAAAPNPRPKRALVYGIAAAVILLIGAIALAWIVSRMRDRPPAAPVATAPAAPEVPDTVAVVVPAPDSLPGESRRVAAMAAAALRRLFQEHRDITLVDESQSEARRVSFDEVIRPLEAAATAPLVDATGDTSDASGSPLISAHFGGKESPPFDISNADEAVRGLVVWVTSSLGLSPESLAPPAGAAASFGEATLAALEGDPETAATAIATTVEAAPDWVPGWRFALDIHRQRGDRASMLGAAREIVRLEPDDAEVQKLLAVSAIEDGDRLGALRHAGAVLRTRSADPTSLEIVGRYALAAGDVRRFGEVVSRLEKLPDAASARRLHRGDPYAMRGELDQALERYYTAGEREPDNASLAFKTGRTAVLRGSMQTAQSELEKLRRLDSDYGAPLLEAFILAQRKDFSGVPALLETAQQNAQWNDDVWTHTAEIWAMAGERGRVMDALERSIARGEVNATLVLRQKPFFYLGYDERGTRIQNQLERNREALELALADVNL